MPKAKNLKYLRKQAGLTQKKFADEIGVSAATVNSWEAKKTAIPVPSAKRIAKYFGVTYTDFCDYDLESTHKDFEKNPPTQEEVEMIFMLRKMPKDFQKKVWDAVSALYELEKAAHKKK